jgi:2-isopropylmalate synthase
MKVRGEAVMHSAWAYGPVEAACKAVDQATGMSGKLLEYALHAATPGKDAVGEVRVVVEYEGMRAEGRGASVNVVESSARAYVAALNRLFRMKDESSRPGGK